MNHSRIKKIIAVLLCVFTLASVTTFATTASAASYSYDYWNHSAPSGSDYAYWNGRRMVKAKGTTPDEIKWMQSAMNYLIRVGYVSADYILVDSKYGPGTSKLCGITQSRLGIVSDKSFGGITIAKVKAVLNSKPWNCVDITTTSKTLSVNMNNIKSTGYQPCSGPCGCYAIAYGRDIRDGKAHKWTEYSVGYLSSKGRYSYTASWTKGNCTVKNGKSVHAVFNAVYDSINNGKPVVVRVNGNGSSGHYITIVGYRNVTNVNSLSAGNFLMIDPVRGNFNKGIVPMTEGSTGYSLANNLQYAIVN